MEGPAVGVDEHEDAATEGHDHVHERVHGPRQQQEPLLVSHAMDEQDAHDDVDDRHQQQDAEEHVRGSVAVLVNDAQQDGVLELDLLLALLQVEEAVDGHADLHEPDQHHGQYADEERGWSEVVATAALLEGTQHGAGRGCHGGVMEGGT